MPPRRAFCTIQLPVRAAVVEATVKLDGSVATIETWNQVCLGEAEAACPRGYAWACRLCGLLLIRVALTFRYTLIIAMCAGLYTCRPRSVVSI